MREPDYVHHLLQDADSEVAYRTVISRAYYAAFHLVIELAVRTGFAPSRSGRDHRLVREHIGSRSLPHARVIATRLDSLRRLRNRADYEMGSLINRALAAEAAAFMDEIVGAVDAALASLPKV